MVSAEMVVVVLAAAGVHQDWCPFAVPVDEWLARYVQSQYLKHCGELGLSYLHDWFHQSPSEGLVSE